MRALVIAAAIAAMLAAAGGAQAHRNPPSWGVGIPGIHKVCVTIGVCHDRPPKIHPDLPDCTGAADGVIVKIWDERLGAYVRYQCRWDEGTGRWRWFRMPLVHRARMPWQVAPYRLVIDFHRACASIVCSYVAREHRYPTKGWGWWE